MATLPLAGVRIVDLTWAGVGPYCTFLCSVMGAECIKVETASRPTHFRGAPPSQGVDKLHPGQRFYSLDELYTNKLGISLNLKHPKGLTLLKELIAVSDVLAENFQAGVLERLGLGYETVRRLNPSLVSISMSAHGTSGPERHGKGLAQVFGAMGGVSYLTGYEGGPPVEIRLPADLISGTAGCYALLVALFNARNTGQGTSVDSVSREVIMSFAGEALLDAQVNQRDPERVGNRDPIMAPHNVYKAKGTDAWLSIAVANDEEWRALAQTIGRTEWLQDSRFADKYQRWNNQRELDRLISEWTAQKDPVDAMELLQSAGVAATASCSARDLLDDPHLHARNSFVVTEDLSGNSMVMMGAPWHFSKTPPSFRSPAPAVGRDNGLVYSELLGLSPSDVMGLVDEGVIR